MTSQKSTEALSKLGREVSASLEGARTTHDAASRVRAKLMARDRPRYRATSGASLGKAVSRPLLFGGLAACATIALAVGFVTTRDAAPIAVGHAPAAPALSFVVGEGAGARPGAPGAILAAPPSQAVPLTFSDGSEVALAPSARVRVTDVARSSARLLVDSGDIHVAVVHREDTRWSVEAGPFEIRVTGTKFGVRWDPEATGLVVRLEEGSVWVKGCALFGEEGRLLLAGEQLEVSCRDRVQSIRPLDTAGDGQDTPSGSQAVQAGALPDAPAGDAPAPAIAAPVGGASKEAGTKGERDERGEQGDGGLNAPSGPASNGRVALGGGAARAIELARRGSHAEAVMEAEASGFGATCDVLGGPELLVLADSARYAGRFERATEALEAVRRRFAGSDAGATAAFELGRIAMDVRRDLSLGGDLFETYLRERPNGSLAREALGRALEARHRSGDNIRAERLAVRYLAAYPDGPFAKLARKINAGNQP